MKKIMNTELSIKNVDEEVELHGWVSKKRNLGGLIFIDLRDRSGIIQLVIRPEDNLDDVVSELRNEYVIRVKGIVSERESKNDKLATGEIEILVNLNSGDFSSTAWGCDLTYDYVKINGDYRT